MYRTISPNDSPIVNPESRKELNKLLKLLEDDNYLWDNLDKPTSWGDIWKINKKNTCIEIEDDFYNKTGTIHYSTKADYSNPLLLLAKEYFEGWEEFKNNFDDNVRGYGVGSRDSLVNYHSYLRGIWDNY